MSWVSSVYKYTHECFTYRHHQVRRSSLGQARPGKGALGKVGQDGAHLSSSSPQGRGADTLLEQGAMGPYRPGFFLSRSARGAASAPGLLLIRCV